MKCPYRGEEMMRGYLMSSRDITFTIDNPFNDYLKSKKIDYVDVNVQDDTEGRDEMIQLTGDMSIPVVRFNDNYVVGFKKDEIDKNLAMI